MLKLKNKMEKKIEKKNKQKPTFSSLSHILSPLHSILYKLATIKMKHSLSSVLKEILLVIFMYLSCKK